MLIGNTRWNIHQSGCRFATPLLEIKLGSGPTVFCKPEFMQPSGTAKDRVSNVKLEKALTEGLISPNGTVVIGTSGTAGISMAAASHSLGLKSIVVVPATVSSIVPAQVERYQGTVVLVDGTMANVIETAESYAHKPDTLLIRQFEDAAVYEAYRGSLAIELAEQAPGAIEYFVSCVGTGGMVIGTHLGLLDQRQSPMVYLALPTPQLRLSEPPVFDVAIPGVAQNLSKLIPPWMEKHRDKIQVIWVSRDSIIDTTLALQGLGYPIGPTSGLNFAAARAIAELHPKAIFATIHPDRIYENHPLLRQLSRKKPA